MGRHALLLAFAMLASQFDLALGQTGIQPSFSPNIRTIPRDTLSDLAVAFADPGNPVVYYNPRLMERYGPEISAFVLAHEEAHIQLGHRRPQGGVSDEALEQLLQGWELEADCLAAAWLARERPAAVKAAIGFFQKMGSGRLDREHPVGSVRAARLIACGRAGAGGTPNGDPRLTGEGPRSTANATWFK